MRNSLVFLLKFLKIFKINVKKIKILFYLLYNFFRKGSFVFKQSFGQQFFLVLFLELRKFRFLIALTKYIHNSYLIFFQVDFMH